MRNTHQRSNWDFYVESCILSRKVKKEKKILNIKWSKDGIMEETRVER